MECAGEEAGTAGPGGGAPRASKQQTRNKTVRITSNVHDDEAFSKFSNSTVSAGFKCTQSEGGSWGGSVAWLSWSLPSSSAGKPYSNMGRKKASMAEDVDVSLITPSPTYQYKATKQREKNCQLSHTRITDASQISLHPLGTSACYTSAPPDSRSDSPVAGEGRAEDDDAEYKRGGTGGGGSFKLLTDRARAGAGPLSVPFGG